MLRVLAADPTAWRHGYELCVEVGVPAGTMYPILIRLADRGLLEATWETAPRHGRPPRHLYRLTGAGERLGASLPAPARGPAPADGTAPAPTRGPAPSGRPRLRTEGI